MIELLETILHTLESIDTHGAENMQKMLGCMEALKQLIEIAKNPQSGAEPDTEGSEQTDG